MPRYDGSFWHTLGRTVEAAAAALPRARGRVRSRRPSLERFAHRAHREERPLGTGAPISGLLTGLATALLATAGSRWARSRRPGLGRLAGGAVAGAGAAGVVYALRIFLDREGPDGPGTEREAADEMLAGAGRGVIYAALLDPYLPGPPLVRGVLAGTADYFAAPLGGLFGRLQALSPIRKVPVLSILLETGDADADPYVDFLLYGAVLGALLGDRGGRH